ncbi:MAG: metal-dependent hydrolase [Candidatus Pacebacteria bacterium]|nr:metal-dependent hydrolase [Candidatus Paceibacterota bacterium]
MTFPAHLLLGLVVGKIMGNYPVAVLASTLVDIDHLQSYVKHGLLTRPRKLWVTLTDKADPYGDQRGILHNVILFAGVSWVLISVFPSIGWIIAIGWFGHLCLDALDSSDYWPLYPYKKINLKGPIDYNSTTEVVFYFFLAIVYFCL